MVGEAIDVCKPEIHVLIIDDNESVFKVAITAPRNEPYCTPSFNQSFSALLEDLSERGLLDETLVAVTGEFGRTPKINKTSGSDHWAHCYTLLLAGGGIQDGRVYGASDAQGAYVKGSPVIPDDFAATILHAFGIDPETAIPDSSGRPVRVTTGRPIVELF